VGDVSVRSILTVGMTTDTPNQLGSTWQVPRGSGKDYDHVELGVGGETYLIYLLAGFKAVIVDKCVEQVGHHCNDPIPVDAEVRDGVVL
jgi:hypothetical protein